MVTEYWPIEGAYKAVRAVMTLRNDIRSYYTGLEVIDIEVGTWSHVAGSARPHSDRYAAIGRVQRFLDGEWTKLVDPETTKPKKTQRSREVAPTRL